MNMRTCTFMIVAAAAGMLCGCSGQPTTATAETKEAPPVRAAVLRIEPKPFTSTVAITGSLVSPASMVLKAETTGKVLRFDKEEGDRVAAGEQIVWVDDSNEKIAVRQAESAVAVAEAALERMRVLETHNESEFERAKNLLQSGGITDRDYKAAELASRDAKAQVNLAQAQLEQARSQLAGANKMLADSVIRSPIDGNIQSKIVSEGAYVEPPTAVCSIVDNTRLELESMVATTDLASIRVGQKVEFTVNAFPDRRFPGRIIEVNPAVQAETRSVKVRIRADNPAGLLKAGMFAQGEIITGTQSSAILIPTTAVYRDDRSLKSARVFVIADGKAARRDITIGAERDSVLEVVGGLQAGDVLITAQSIELADGVRVEPDTGEAGESGL